MDNDEDLSRSLQPIGRAHLAAQESADAIERTLAAARAQGFAVRHCDTCTCQVPT